MTELSPCELETVCGGKDVVKNVNASVGNFNRQVDRITNAATGLAANANAKVEQAGQLMKDAEKFIK